jgi:hypothetical protein
LTIKKIECKNQLESWLKGQRNKPKLTSRNKKLILDIFKHENEQIRLFYVYATLLFSAVEAQRIAILVQGPRKSSQTNLN